MVKKLQRQITCDWVDDSINDQSIELLSQYNLNLENFLFHFKKLIGRYRSFKKFNDTAPMPKEAIQHLQKTRRQITNLIESIDLIPSNAHAWNTEAVFNRMKSDPSAQMLIDHKMTSLLEQYSCVLIYSISKLEEDKNSKGRNKDLALHEFIHNTYLSLEKNLDKPIKKSALYDLISKFLIMNGINVPTEPENIGKIIIKIKKAKNNTSKV